MVFLFVVAFLTVFVVAFLTVFVFVLTVFVVVFLDVWLRARSLGWFGTAAAARMTRSW